MGVDYADYFWGEKHLGYHALYQNMKNGHDAVQELAQFVKERASLEDEHGKLFGKSLTRINSFTNSGSFSSAWTITRNTLELMNDIQGTLVKNLQELHKEVNKYGDDLQKSRRRVKEQDTFDAVNLMQTTTTCLQKAKETYVSRSLELEKLKKENTAPKEIGKAENKLNKAREEYKQYIEKYSKVRDDFEEKMVKSARAFQAQDHAHVSSMRKLLASFARHIEESHAAAAQVSSQFRETVENLAIDDILLQFAEEKGTGRERPDFAIFEEVDVSSMHTPAATTPHTPPSLTNHDSSPIMTSLPTLSIGSSTHMTPYDDLIGLDILGGESSSLAANVPHQQQSQASPAASDTSSSTATATQPATISHSTSRQKLSLWLPGRKKNASNSSIVDTNSPTVQDSSLVSSANSEGGSGGGGFLRKRNKKPSKKGSKETTTPSTAELPPLNILEDGRSSASSKSDERMPHNSAGTGAGVGGVDEEGFSIRPPDDPTKPRWSDSSDSSDDEAVQRSKLKQIQIKPLDQSTSNLNASVDELRDAVGQMTIGRSALGKSRTFDKDPWTATAGPTRSGMTAPMRPALTGDDHLNRTYAGGEYSSAKTLMPMQPSLTGSMSRARPRSNTPTTMFSILGAPGQLALGRRDSNGSSTDSSFYRSDSIGSLADSGALSGSTSDLAGYPSDVIPIAMAINEYAHAWFQGTDLSKLKVRALGSVMISFPASSVAALIDPSSGVEPLKFSLTKASKVHALIPNKQILSAEAVSQFGSLESHQFTFDQVGLANHLKKEHEAKPSAPFYNFEVLRYEVRNVAAPLMLESYWKCEMAHTDLRVDYRLNQDCPIEGALLNLTFATKINGKVSKTIAKPDADWSDATESLTWRLTELSKHGDASGSLKARLTVSSGPSTPAPTAVQFQAADATLSGTTVQFDNPDKYRLSLLRRKVLSGKYICDAEVR